MRELLHEDQLGKEPNSVLIAELDVLQQERRQEQRPRLQLQKAANDPSFTIMLCSSLIIIIVLERLRQGDLSDPIISYHYTRILFAKNCFSLSSFLFGIGRDIYKQLLLS